MALPVGISTATVTFGKDRDILGANASVSLRIVPSHTLVWEATGERIPAFEVTADAAEGVVGSFAIPHTDQDGFLNAAGAAITNWYYTIFGTVRRGSVSKTYRKVLQVASGTTTVDLDLVPEDGTVGAVGSAPLPPVTSVNGQTGAVVISGGGDGGSIAATIIETGSEARPDVDVWVAVNPSQLVVANALETDPIIDPSSSAVPDGGTTGQALVKASNADGDVEWGTVAGGSSGSPAYLSSRKPWKASRWIMPPLTSNGGNDDTVAGRMSLHRYEFTETVQVTGLATDVFGDPGAGVSVRMGIYDSLTATAPIAGTEKVVSATTAGTKQDTSLAVTLSPGVYWVACVPQGGTAGVRHVVYPTAYKFFDEPHNALQFQNSWSDGNEVSRWVSGVTGALPNLSTATFVSESAWPLAVTLRIA